MLVVLPAEFFFREPLQLGSIQRNLHAICFSLQCHPFVSRENQLSKCNRTFVPLSSPKTGMGAPDVPATAAISYPLSLPMSPRTDVCFSGTTWYNDRGPVSSSLSLDDPVFRSSRKSGVSRPPATVDTTDVRPEGVSRPEGVCKPSVGAVDSGASSASDSDSSSSSSSSSAGRSVNTPVALGLVIGTYLLQAPVHPTGSCRLVRQPVENELRE